MGASLGGQIAYDDRVLTRCLAGTEAPAGRKCVHLCVSSSVRADEG